MKLPSCSLDNFRSNTYCINFEATFIQLLQRLPITPTTFQFVLLLFMSNPGRNYLQESLFFIGNTRTSRSYLVSQISMQPFFA